MRFFKGKYSFWTRCFNPFIFSVIFRIVIRVECVEYRTFDVIPDGTGRIAQVVEVNSGLASSDQFASRRDFTLGYDDLGSLDIRSQYWTRSGRDSEYPDESEGEIVGLTEEEAERRPHVQVDRSGKEHTVTINMPRMEGRGRNPLIKKFVLQPVIQYVVQYEKNSQQENGEEAQASTNFEDYEGYPGQEKMVKGHERSVDRFFNDIDANFETYWGNDGKGGGYQEGGDNMPGDGGYQSGGSSGDVGNGSGSQGGYGGGYDNQGNQDGTQSQRGYESMSNEGASQGGFGGMSSGGDQGGYNEGNAGGGGFNSNGVPQTAGGGYASESNGGVQDGQGGFNNGGAQFKDFKVGVSGTDNNQRGNAVAHDFGFTQEGPGGYSSTNQFHQPPDVNAFVSSGGYGVPPQSSLMPSLNMNAGGQSSGYHGGTNGMQGGGMNLANAAQVTAMPQAPQSGNSGMTQMFSSMQSANRPMIMNGMGSFGGSGGNGDAVSVSYGPVGGGEMRQMGSTNTITGGMGSGMNVGMHSSNPATASLNSLYGVPGMIAGKPLGIEMMMNAINGGGSSAAAAVASMANSMMGMSQGPTTPASTPSVVSTDAGNIQNTPMRPFGSIPQAVGIGTALSSSTMGSVAGELQGMGVAPPILMGANAMNGITSVGGYAGLPMGMALPSSSQMGTGLAGTAVTFSGKAILGNANGISMGFGVPGPILMTGSSVGGMAVGQPSTSYGAPGSSTSSDSQSYGPPKESSQPSIPPSSFYGSPKESMMDGYVGGSNGRYPNQSYGPPKEDSQPNKTPSSSYGPPKESMMDGYSNGGGSNGGGNGGYPSQSYGPQKENSQPNKTPSSSYGPTKESMMDGYGGGSIGGGNGGYPSQSYGPPKENSRPSKQPSSSYGPPKESPGGYGGGTSSEDDLTDDMAPPRGKGRKPGGGGKSKGRGSRGGKSLLSSLPLPKIPQSIGGHLSFMFSTGVGKGRRNRGGGMMGGGGGGKPGGENSKSVSKDQNGNRTSLNQTSNLPEDMLGDVVDLLPVDAEVLIIPTITPTDVPPENTSEVTTTSTPSSLSTTTPRPTEPYETELVPKPSNKILIATIPPPLNASSKPLLPKSILIATIPPLTTPSSIPPPASNKPMLIATPEPSTVKPTTIPAPTTSSTLVGSTILPSTTASPIPPPALAKTTIIPLFEASTSVPLSNPSTSTLTPTSLPSLTTSLPITTPPVKILQRIQTQLRQPKNLALPKVLIATPTPRSNTEIILTPIPTSPHPTPSISIEIDPIQDYINHNLRNNVLTVTNNSPVSYSTSQHPRPNIQAYYAQHDFHRNPVKIEHFDPWIYDALQAAFMPPSNDLDGQKRKRSRFPTSASFRHQFPFPQHVARPRSWFSRLLSKRTDSNGNSSSLAVIPSTSISLQHNEGH